MSAPAKAAVVVVEAPKDSRPKSKLSKPTDNGKEPSAMKRKVDQTHNSDDSCEDDDVTHDLPDPSLVDPNAAADRELIAKSTPTSELEIALKAELDRQLQLNERLKSEVGKLKAFISKRRKGGYKRKRKDEEAPRKSLSAYNIFVRERFAKLAKANEAALSSGDSQQQLTRVPAYKKVSEAGQVWRAMSAKEKAKYEAMAKPDKDRYEEQMATYQAPESKGINRKRNKTGYNLFFSAHVLRMKNSDEGVPPERGSVARIVGEAWKAMSAEEKNFYEREADKHNEQGVADGVNQHQPPVNMQPLAVAPPAPQALAAGGPPTPGYPEYPPPTMHPYYDSRYGPPPPGPYGYEYYGYPPTPSARGQPDPYALGPSPAGPPAGPPAPNYL